MAKKDHRKMFMGYHFNAWWRLLRANRFHVRPRYLPLAAATLAVGAVNSARHAAQLGRWREKLDALVIPPPVFIIGHWRSGTTLLHNLMSLDQRFAWPNSMQCFFPSSILAPAPLMRFWSRRLTPKRRPMDKMVITPVTPQEDEFALGAMGAPSPYARIAFPNHPDPFPGALEVDSLPDDQRVCWEETFMLLLRELNFRDKRPLLLKSPTHTSRIPVLLRLLPEARFVHIVRSPRSVIPSTINLWRCMYPLQAWEKPDFRNLEEDVFATYNRMMQRVGATSSLPPERQYQEIRFEELVENPLASLSGVYEKLGLSLDDRTAAAVKAYWVENRRHSTGSWARNDPIQARIDSECKDIPRRYNYD